MKNYLLSLATAALLATGAQAQPLPGLNVKKAKKALPTMMTSMPTTLQQGRQLQVKQSKLIQSLNRNLNARVDDSQRSHKELSYQVNGDESMYGGLVGLGTNFAQMAAKGVSGIGYAHLYIPEQLRSLAGNKISKIVFTAWMGNYSDIHAFILDPSTMEVLWDEPIDALNTLDMKGQGEYNIIDCDYEITGAEEGLVIGWIACKASQSASDGYYAKNGIVATSYNDNTGLGYGTFIMAADRDGNYVPFSQLRPIAGQDGKPQVIASDLFCLTEGDAAIPDADASVLAANPIRTLTGSDKGLDLFIQNCGLDPITSVECEFTVNGKTAHSTYNLPKPLLYLQSGGISPKALLPETASTANGTVEIIKVNGEDDAYVTENDNIGEYPIVTMDKAYNRTPVYEVHNCTETDFADDGVLAVQKFNKNYKDKDGIALHGFISPYSDFEEPLESESYFNVVANYFQGKLPAAFANREYVTTTPYEDVDDLTQAVLQSPAEASITVEADLPGGYGTNATVDAKAKIAFSTNAPAGKYGVSFILAEDQVEQPVFSYLGYYIQENLKAGNPEGAIKDYYGFDDTQWAYGLAAEFDGQKFYYATTPLDGVVLGTNDPFAKETILPEVKSGQEYEIDFRSIPYNGSRKPSINEENLHVVALLIDRETAAIVTAVKTPVGTTSQPSSINTVNKEGDTQIEALNGAFSVKAAHATAEVYTLDGRLVSSCTVNGQASLPTFGQGTFIIRVVEGNKVTSKKAAF